MKLGIVEVGDAHCAYVGVAVMDIAYGVSGIFQPMTPAYKERRMYGVRAEIRENFWLIEPLDFCLLL